MGEIKISEELIVELYAEMPKFKNAISSHVRGGEKVNVETIIRIINLNIDHHELVAKKAIASGKYYQEAAESKEKSERLQCLKKKMQSLLA